MRIGILYICTGRYDIFWKDFYASSEKHLLPGVHKEYFVFTDAAHIEGEESATVHKIYQEKMGWPYDTLLRFEVFLKVREELRSFDYLFFFNANALIVADILPEELLPSGHQELVAAIHPGYYNSDPREFTYEKKQKRSTAYLRTGKHYVAGGINGGTAGAYLGMIETLAANIRQDLDHGIIAIWHDESHWNRYVSERDVRLLSTSFVYPEGWDIPFKPVIVIRDKSRLGGHNFLRGVQDTARPSLLRRVIRKVRKFFRN